MNAVSLLSILLCSQCVSCWKKMPVDDFGVPYHLNTEQVLTRFNYPVIKYEVKTEDNYTIEVFNVPHGPQTTDKKTRVVLLLPGIQDQSYKFFVSANLSLGFVLPNEGYDTWAINFRGQSDTELFTYADGLGPKGSQWKFSIDELALFDTPAAIDFVLNKTEASKLTVIGHSMGSTATLMLLADKPGYNQKVDLLVAIPPAVYVTPHTGPGWPYTRYLALGLSFYLINSLGGFQKVHPSGMELRLISTLVCPIGLGYYNFLCRKAFWTYVGNGSQIPIKEFDQLLTHWGSSSFRQLFQFIQHSSSGRFAHYNYGAIGNVKRYGALMPPLYDLRRITTPCALLQGGHDQFTNEYNNRYLARNIPKVVLNVVLPVFNHLQFTTPSEAHNEVNHHILKLLRTDYTPASSMEVRRAHLRAPIPGSVPAVIARKIQAAVFKTIHLLKMI